MRHDVLGVGIDAVTEAQALDIITGFVREGGAHQVVTANPEILDNVTRTPALHALIRRAALVTADGQGVLLAGRILGTPFPARVTGIELAEALCRESAARGLSLYFLGAAPGVVDEAAEKVARISERGDSAGGVVECVVFGLPAGLGDNLWDGLESKISAVLYGIPAVKGVEFGAGFAIADMTGSRANDPFVLRDGKVTTATNNAGGINGGISNGMPVVVRAAFRPTPSVSVPQRTVDLETMSETEITVKGRHDATVVPRAAVVTECAVALVVYDEMLKCQKEKKCLKGVQND